MKERYKDIGITLIALVVTIVILIILATISLNVLFGEDGIITRAAITIEIQKLAEEKEKIELAKASVAMTNKGKMPVNEYVEELITEGVTSQENIKYNEDGSVQITTYMGRNLNIEIDEAGNIVEVTEVVKKDSLTVEIENVQLTTKTHSIKVELEIARGEGATYIYSYKEETGEYVQAYKGTETNCTIEKLKEGTTYWIKIEAVNDYGSVFKEILGETKDIVSGQESVADLQKIAEYSDEFEMIELDAMIENLGTMTEKLFIEAVKKDGIVTEENISINSDGNYEMMTVERYVFEVVLKSENDIEVNYIGIAES